MRWSHLLVAFFLFTNIIQSQGQTPSVQWYSLKGGSSPAALKPQPAQRLSQIKAQVASARQTTLHAELPGMGLFQTTLADKQSYQAVQAPGATFGQPGSPAVPVFSQVLLVPNGAKMRITAQPGKPKVFKNINLAPVQRPKPDSDALPDPPFVRDETLYAVNADYPGNFYEAMPVSQMRGQDFVQIWIHPYQYNPATQELKVYDQLALEVTFSGGGKPIRENLKSENFTALYSKLAPNAQAVLDLQSQTEPDLKAPQGSEPSLQGNGSTGGCELLIITDAAFDGAAQDLATWKRMRGIKTKVVSTATAGSTAQDIEDYIDASQLWSPAPEFVLLLGDAEYIPTFYNITHSSDPYTPTSGGLMQHKVASDRYYGDTNDNWRADLYVGRLPADTAAEAQIMCDRIIDYEKTPPDPDTHASFYQKAAIAAFFQDYDDYNTYADRRFAKTSEDIYQFLSVSEGYNAQRIYNTEAGVTPLYWSTEAWAQFENDTVGGAMPAALRKPGFAWDGDKADITAAINGGCFFVTHRDHGSRLMYSSPAGYWYPGGWGEPEYRGTDAAALTNGELCPVVWSLNCETGWFDNETDDAAYEVYSGGSVLRSFYSNAGDECFVEKFLLNANGGAVGVIGATRISYSGYNDRLAWGFMDAIWPGFIEYHSGVYGTDEPIYQMGPAFEYGRNYLLTKAPYIWDDTQTAIDEFHWFGDPSMEMWTDVPQALDVTHRSSMGTGVYNSLLVSVEQDGSPVEGARITVSCTASANDYWTAQTDANGQVDFGSIMPSQVADYDVVVTKHNSVPYVGTIAAVDSFPSVTEFSLYDSSPTSKTQVRFLLKFSETVYNVKTSNFTLSSTGLTSPTIDQVWGFGAARLIVVNTGTGDGTVSVLMNDTASIKDADGFGLSGSTYFSETFQIDKTTPTCTLVGPGSPNNTSPLEYTINFDEAVTGLEAGDFLLTNATADSLTGSGTGPYTLSVTPLGQGTVGVQVPADAAKDEAGNGNSASDEWNVLYDTIGPTMTLTCQQNSPTNVTPLEFEGHLSELSPGFNSTDLTVTNGAVQNFTSSGFDFSFEVVPQADGEVSVSISDHLLCDAVGNLNEDGVQSIIVFDATEPAGSLAINAEAAITSQTQVTLTLGASDSGVGVDKIRLCRQGQAWGDWEDWVAQKSWALDEEDQGEQTLCLQVRDLAGNVSAMIESSIELDSLGPQSQVLLPASPAVHNRFEVNWSSTDTGVGVRDVEIQWDRGDENWVSLGHFEPSVTSLQFNAQTWGNGTYRFRAIGCDQLGNVETPDEPASIQVNVPQTAVRHGWSFYQ